MPICENCNGEEFQLHDGLYFCTVCNVQSQEIVEHELEEFDAAAFAVESKKTTQKSKPVVDQGKPWYTVEGYQVILKSQIAALVELGCSPQLYGTVKQLWFKYVHKSGIAVIDPTLPSRQKPADYCQTFRDRYLNGDLGKKCLKTPFPDVKNPNSKFFNHPLYTKTGRKRERDDYTSSDSDDDEFNSERIRKKKKQSIQNDKIFRWEQESDSFDNSSSEESDDVTHIKNCFTSKTKAKSKSQTNGMHELRLIRLISLLQVALQWNEEPVTSGDLVQWIREGYLPFIEYFKPLLPHMKIAYSDVNDFRPHKIPSYQNLVVGCKEMSDYLDVPLNVSEELIRKLIARFLIQLNLPRSLMCFIDTLMKTIKYKYESSHKCKLTSYHVPECEALALIIVAFKLLCGLDDQREWLEEEVAPCNNHKTCQPFSFKDWANYHCGRILEERRNPRHCFVSIDPADVENLYCYVKHWKEVILESAAYSKEDTRLCASDQSLRDRAEAKASVFKKLCDMQGTTDAMRSCSSGAPFVFPSPKPENDMGLKCLKGVMKFLEQDKCDYIFYSDSYSRMSECFKPTISSCKYSLQRDSWVRGNFDVHMSYDFVLTMAENMDKEIYSRDKIIQTKYEILSKKYEDLAKANERLAEQVFQTNRMVTRLQKRRLLLIKRLERHGDDLKNQERKFVIED